MIFWKTGYSEEIPPVLVKGKVGGQLLIDSLTKGCNCHVAVIELLTCIDANQVVLVSESVATKDLAGVHWLSRRHLLVAPQDSRVHGHDAHAGLQITTLPKQGAEGSENSRRTLTVLRLCRVDF